MAESALARSRERYAEEICRLAGVESAELIRAFATIPREDFLGRGPGGS